MVQSPRTPGVRRRPLLERIGRLHRLVVFDAAARHGTFTAAADELGMTQPAVSRQIRELENSLGVDLFLRSANRTRLSPMGGRFHRHVSAALGSIEDGVGELIDAVDTIMIAAHPGVAQQWLMPRLDGLAKALGGTDARLWLFNADSELDGSYDVAIRVGDGRFPGQACHYLFPEVVVPVAAPSVAARWDLNENSTAADVYRAPLVHMDDDPHPWISWSGWLANFGLTLHRLPGRVLFHNYSMVLQQALAGRGVALGWRPLVDDLIAGGALVVVGPTMTSDQGYWVTWPDGPPSPPVAALVDWLDREVRGWAEGTEQLS